MKVPSFGIGLQSDKSTDEYRRLAQQIERGGFEVVSVYSDFGYQPPLAALTVMAEVTERIRLGPACLNPFSLAPFEIAGQIATLDLMSNGRAYLGIARGTWLDAVGIEQSRAIPAMRDAIEVCRRLWRNDGAAYDGEVFRLGAGARFEYDVLRADIPVMIGTWGPRTLTLAGELADEVKIGGSSNPDIVPWVREQVLVGAVRSARAVEADVGVCVGAVTVVDEDRDAARDLARSEVAKYLAVVADLDPTVEISAALRAEMAGLVSLGHHEQAGELIRDDVLDRFAFAGTPRDVASQVQRLIDAGATRIEFGTPHGLTADRGIELLADEVIANFR